MQRARPGFAISLALVLGIAACKPGAPPAPAIAPEAARAPSTPAIESAPEPPKCPDADFASFLKRFESSADVQRVSTARVVTMDSIDGNAQPEPMPVTRQVPRTEITFPIMLGPERRKREGLESTVTEFGPVEREVRHGVPDSGVQVRFNFQATPCWTLVRVSDDTI